MVPTDTVFLRDRNDHVIFAVFPRLAATVGREDTMTCYSHVGQHGSATLDYCDSCAEVIDPAEYAELAAELGRVGYNVRVVQKDSLDHTGYAAERRRQVAR